MSTNTHSIDFELSSSEGAYISDANAANTDVGGDISIEMWVKLEQLPSTATDQFQLVIKANAADTTVPYNFNIRSDDKLSFYYDQGTGTLTRSQTDAVAFDSGDVGEWVHIAVTADVSAQAIIFYKNGVAIADTNQTTSASSMATVSDGDLAVGYDKNNTRYYFDGLIDEVRIWSDIRSASEIADNRFSELVGDETNLVAYWRFNNSYVDTVSSYTLTAVGTPTFETDIPFVNSPSPSASLSPSISPSQSPSASLSPSISPSQSPSSSLSPSASLSPSISPSVSPSASLSPSISSSPSPSVSPSVSPSPSPPQTIWTDRTKPSAATFTHRTPPAAATITKRTKPSTTWQNLR